MTSFSLFHRPTFQRKLRDVTSLTHLQAFLSALFSYALRYKETIPSLKTSALEAKEMLEISSRLQMKCVEGCLDDDPPLHLLQSFLLVTFQKLIHGVRGRTWRMLGECIRIAYELRLHLIDVESIKGQSEISHDIEHETFILTEERRRVWWACYEMDIFASTIRKMPNAIDERLNCTRLPVSDDDWFRGFESRSCFLLPDATHRWKEVAASGNQSPQTWFILINSYMFDAFQMGAFPEVWQKRVGFHADQLPSKKKTSVPDLRKFLDFLENCLQCAQIALPEQLEWKERLLVFDGASRAIDCARFSIHVMSQLARLMLCIWEVNRASMALQHSETDRGRSASFSHPTPTATAAQEQAWVKYIDAANLTARMVRNSAPYHLRFVNPLIANAIWISAASLVVAKLFAPHNFDSCQAQSNFDLLVVTLNKYEAFWEIPCVLKHKLQNLESTLRNIRQCTPGTEDATMVDGRSPMFSASDPVQQSHAQAHTSHLSNVHSQQAVDLSSNTVTDFSSQDWLAQDFFDFNAIPSLGPGPSRSITPFVFDPIFDGNVLSDTEFFNFNDLFAYPYQ
ncbi:hypothetical protein LTS08_002698 [Lithohypha guttulata]|nr:hypothetical protein LTS08_002698 [Lithohypha guttulata]